MKIAFFFAFFCEKICKIQFVHRIFASDLKPGCAPDIIETLTRPKPLQYGKTQTTTKHHPRRGHTPTRRDRYHRRSEPTPGRLLPNLRPQGPPRTLPYLRKSV